MSEIEQWHPQAPEQNKSDTQQSRESAERQTHSLLLKEVPVGQERARAMRDLLVRTMIGRLQSAVTDFIESERARAMRELLMRTMIEGPQRGVTNFIRHQVVSCIKGILEIRRRSPAEQKQSVANMDSWLRSNLDVEYDQNTGKYTLSINEQAGNNPSSGMERFAIRSLLYATREAVLSGKKFPAETKADFSALQREEYEYRKALQHLTSFTVDEEDVLKIAAHLMVGYLPSAQRRDKPERNLPLMKAMDDVLTQEEWVDWSVKDIGANIAWDQDNDGVYALLRVRHLQNEELAPRTVSPFVRNYDGQWRIFFLDKNPRSTRIYRATAGYTKPTIEVLDPTQWYVWKKITEKDPEFKGVGKNITDPKLRKKCDILTSFAWAGLQE